MKKSDREKIFNKYKGCCAYCGVELDIANMRIDHIRPKASGHKDVDCIENFNPACPVCNNWKHSDNIESFRKSIQTQARKCRDYSRNFRMAERYGLVLETYKPIKFYFETFQQEEKIDNA